ncbi:MAG TPA: thiomuracin/GE37468 family thiazolyl RiPP peptide [Amycolatopsis sp.]|nr:thiomuracin/GE37468 family thiazolyl RiPP peptide [Amycolatopsis sp.]
MSLDSASPRPRGSFAAPNLNLDDLPVDVFDVDGGLTVESLTGGHGMTELGASCVGPCVCHVPFCSCSQEQEVAISPRIDRR